MDQNHEGSALGSNVSSESSGGSSLYASVWLKIQEGFTKFVISMESSEVKQYGWKRKTLSIIYYLYIFWVSIFLPTLGSYNWGEYGEWLFTVINYPITLSFHLLPFGAIAALGAASFLLIACGVVSFFLALHAIFRSSKQLDRYKKAATTLGNIIQVLSMIMTFIFTSFIDCDTSALHTISNYDEQIYVLSRFNTTPCVMSGNIVLIVLMIIAFIPMLILNFLSIMISQESEQTKGGYFIGDNNIPMGFLSVANPLQLMLMYVVPQQYAYIRSVIHITITLVFMVLIFYFLPFYRKTENSFVFGVAGARLGAAIGALITSIVNSDDNSILGIGLGAGLTLGLIMTGFLVGMAGLEIYMTVIYRKVRGRFMVSIRRAEALSSILRRSNDGNADAEKLPLKMLEKEAQLVYQEFEEDNRLKQLNLFFKFSLKSKNRTEGDDITDPEIALSLIKGASLQKSFNDSRLLLTCSLIVSYYWKNEVNAQVFASSLLKKALKAKPNFLYKFLISEREKEFEMIDNSNPYELKFFLQRMEKNQSELAALHRAFWKEMTNDIINFDKIEQTNTRASELMSECESTFQNLIAKHRNNKTVLRYYASYVEKFKFNKEFAQELFQEAMAIEDEEAKMKFRPNLKKGASKKNRIVPNFSFDDNPPPSSTKFSEAGGKTFSFGIKKGNNIASTADFNEFDDPDEPFERASEFDLGSQRMDGVENNPQLKRESILRSSLATPQQHNVQLLSFLIFVIASFLLLASGIIWDSVISSLVLSDIKAVQSACKPRMVPLLALRDIRLQQTYLNLYKNSPSENLKLLHTLDMSSTEEFIAKLKGKLSKAKQFIDDLRVMGQKGLFTPEMYSDYISVSRQIVVPNVENPNDLGIFNNTNPSNVSISQMVYSMMKHIEYFEGLSPNEYNSTLSSYPFMFLWLNQDAFQGAFDVFCQSFISRTQQKTEVLDQSFFIYFLASNSLYGVLTIVYVVYVTISFSSLKTFVKLLEKNVPKDVIGKIYHNLGKQSEVDDASIQLPKRILKPYMSAALIGLCIVGVTILCSGMFYMESSFNTISTHRTMLNIKEATTALSSIQRTTFNVGELFNYISLPSGLAINDPQLSKEGSDVISYKTEMKTLTTNLVSSWNNLAYGNVEDNKLPSVGISTKIDSMVQDTNCTSNSTIYSCKGLEHLIEIYAQLSSENTADIFAMKSATFKLFSNQVQTYVLADALTDRLLVFLDTLISVFSVTSVSYVIAFSLVGAVLLLVFSFALYNIFDSHWNNVFHVRIMFNYIPLDLMDSEETMRNFIMYHTLPSRITMFKNRETKENAKNDDSKVKNILNAAVDGAVLCSHRGDIEIFNPAAQRMFGCKQTDFVGLPLFNLFDSSNRDTLGKVIDDLIKASKDNTNADAQGETIEVECIRKNNTKFPAKINLFSTLFDNKPVVTCFIKDVTSEKKQNALLAEEKKKSENLLRSILPEAVANRLKSGETFIAEKFNDITCFFSDMVGFTSISSCLTPTEIVMMLNSVVNGFDSLTDKYQLEKIKTIGDAYFCVGGIGNTQSDHPERTLRFAMDIFAVLRNYNLENRQALGHQINVRVGINTGGVVAGVIGTKKFAYDLWGDTINMASRMESTSLGGRIHCSRSTYERVYDLGFEFEERMVEVKGKGLCTTYMMKAHHHACAVVSEDEVAGHVVSQDDPQQNSNNNSNHNIHNTEKQSYPDSNLSKDSDQLEYQYISKNNNSSNNVGGGTN
ncbi:predicted protein [Naegleria gruberi]|uniref:Predicted protein n=1 Tax=Naegleria gruberi TaxID=5762 RepID=D2VNH6_NAEGR|nr:uncharacterized protein NAEGRDRAFT_70501 [Naegleria gruberi]EFC41734.1 predicted protein [Naegleria gruberi]|eukprot:XP_002674478.1 predicted protein [Naegleria gruberi strain NEG-M]